MAKIVQIQRYAPDPKGSGGHHRLYQTFQDLISASVNSDIGAVSLVKKVRTDKSWKSYYGEELSERLACFGQVIRNKCNPITLLQALMRNRIKTRNPFGLVSLNPYFQYIKTNGKPDVCIVDYPNFIELAHFNNKNDIATIYISHNVESFTNIVHRVNDGVMRLNCALEWLAELEMFNLCQERLMISLTETDLVRGLGLSAIYYPYVPVNEIRSRLLLVRKERERCEIDKGLFLMVGSIFHGPTGAGFRWLLNNVKRHGLPDGLKIIVGGVGGEGLLDEFGRIPGLVIRGRLTQEELDELLKKACGMLIPQLSGFGALTRISEMACAGIPVITTNHALMAIDAPPCVQAVPDEWDSWVTAMQTIKDNPEPIDWHAYEVWEASQPRPLKEAVEKFI